MQDSVDSSARAGLDDLETAREFDTLVGFDAIAALQFSDL
ncbi:hypothetical protein GFS60_05108 [Rhodococcus sp. WAY2]|nr:hypothetical protein GFS60_05105 [Rhodococcus sp. WAY2]QHE71499.1 hypothetical protein GFS60_05108 [Rhodococcus sp. WAY2]